MANPATHPREDKRANSTRALHHLISLKRALVTATDTAPRKTQRPEGRWGKRSGQYGLQANQCRRKHRIAHTTSLAQCQPAAKPHSPHYQKYEADEALRRFQHENEEIKHGRDRENARIELQSCAEEIIQTARLCASKRREITHTLIETLEDHAATIWKISKLKNIELIRIPGNIFSDIHSFFKKSAFVQIDLRGWRLKNEVSFFQSRGPRTIKFNIQYEGQPQESRSVLSSDARKNADNAVLTFPQSARINVDGFELPKEGHGQQQIWLPVGSDNSVQATLTFFFKFEFKISSIASTLPQLVETKSSGDMDLEGTTSTLSADDKDITLSTPSVSACHDSVSEVRSSLNHIGNELIKLQNKLEGLKAPARFVPCDIPKDDSELFEKLRKEQNELLRSEKESAASHKHKSAESILLHLNEGFVKLKRLKDSLKEANEDLDSNDLIKYFEKMAVGQLFDDFEKAGKAFTQLLPNARATTDRNAHCENVTTKGMLKALDKAKIAKDNLDAPLLELRFALAHLALIAAAIMVCMSSQEIELRAASAACVNVRGLLETARRFAENTHVSQVGLHGEQLHLDQMRVMLDSLLERRKARRQRQQELKLLLDPVYRPPKGVPLIALPRNTGATLRCARGIEGDVRIFVDDDVLLDFETRIVGDNDIIERLLLVTNELEEEITLSFSSSSPRLFELSRYTISLSAGASEFLKVLTHGVSADGASRMYTDMLSVGIENQPALKKVEVPMRLVVEELNLLINTQGLCFGSVVADPDSQHNLVVTVHNCNHCVVRIKAGMSCSAAAPFASLEVLGKRNVSIGPGDLASFTVRLIPSYFEETIEGCSFLLALKIQGLQTYSVPVVATVFLPHFTVSAPASGKLSERSDLFVGSVAPGGKKSISLVVRNLTPHECISRISISDFGGADECVSAFSVTPTLVFLPASEFGQLTDIEIKVAFNASLAPVNDCRALLSISVGASVFRVVLVAAVAYPHVVSTHSLFDIISNHASAHPNKHILRFENCGKADAVMTWLEQGPYMDNREGSCSKYFVPVDGKLEIVVRLRNSVDLPTSSGLLYFEVAGQKDPVKIPWSLKRTGSLMTAPLMPYTVLDASLEPGAPSKYVEWELMNRGDDAAQVFVYCVSANEEILSVQVDSHMTGTRVDRLSFPQGNSTYSKDDFLQWLQDPEERKKLTKGFARNVNPKGTLNLRLHLQAKADAPECDFAQLLYVFVPDEFALSVVGDGTARVCTSIVCAAVGHVGNISSSSFSPHMPTGWTNFFDVSSALMKSVLKSPCAPRSGDSFRRVIDVAFLPLQTRNIPTDILSSELSAVGAFGPHGSLSSNLRAVAQSLAQGTECVPLLVQALENQGVELVSCADACLSSDAGELSCARVLLDVVLAAAPGAEFEPLTRALVATLPRTSFVLDDGVMMLVASHLCPRDSVEERRFVFDILVGFHKYFLLNARGVSPTSAVTVASLVADLTAAIAVSSPEKRFSNGDVGNFLRRIAVASGKSGNAEVAERLRAIVSLQGSTSRDSPALTAAADFLEANPRVLKCSCGTEVCMCGTTEIQAARVRSAFSLTLALISSPLKSPASRALELMNAYNFNDPCRLLKSGTKWLAQSSNRADAVLRKNLSSLVDVVVAKSEGQFDDGSNFRLALRVIERAATLLPTQTGALKVVKRFHNHPRFALVAVIEALHRITSLKDASVSMEPAILTACDEDGAKDEAGFDFTTSQLNTACLRSLSEFEEMLLTGEIPLSEVLARATKVFVDHAATVSGKKYRTVHAAFAAIRKLVSSLESGSVISAISALLEIGCIAAPNWALHPSGKLLENMSSFLLTPNRISTLVLLSSIAGLLNVPAPANEAINFMSRNDKRMSAKDAEGLISAVLEKEQPDVADRCKIVFLAILQTNNADVLFDRMIEFNDDAMRKSISLARAISTSDTQFKLQEIDAMGFIASAIQALEDNFMVDAAIVPSKVFAMLHGAIHSSLLIRAVSVVAFATAALEIPKALQMCANDPEMMISSARGDQLFYLFGVERGAAIHSLAHESFKDIYHRSSDRVKATIAPFVSTFFVDDDIHDKEFRSDEVWSYDKSGDEDTTDAALDQSWYKVLGGPEQVIVRFQARTTSQPYALTRTAIHFDQIQSQWGTFKITLEKVRKIQECELKQRYPDGSVSANPKTVAFLGATQTIHTLTASWCSLYTATSKVSSIARAEATVPNESELCIATAEAIASGIELVRAIQLQQDLLVEVLGPRGRRPLMNGRKHLIDILQRVTCTPEILTPTLEHALRWIRRLGDVETADDEKNDFASCIGAKAIHSNTLDLPCDPGHSYELPTDPKSSIHEVESNSLPGPDGPDLVQISPVFAINNDILIPSPGPDTIEFSWKDAKLQSSWNPNIPTSSLPLSSPLATMESNTNAFNSSSIVVEIELSVEVPVLTAADIRRELTGKILDKDFYKDTDRVEMATNPTAIRDRYIGAKMPKVDRWSFESLSESAAMRELISCAMQGVDEHPGMLDLIADLAQLTTLSPVEHVLQWALVVDNSGSMSIHENFVLEAVVLAIHVLTKAEMQVAVVKVGAPGKELVVKGFDDPLSTQNGQLIMDRMTFNESSQLASGISAACSALWKDDPTGSKHATTEQNDQGRLVLMHHLMVMITDAKSREFNTESVSDIRSANDKFDLQLGMLVMGDDHDDSFKQFLETFTSPNPLEFVNEHDTGLMLEKTIHLMFDMLTQVRIAITQLVGGSYGVGTVATAGRVVAHETRLFGTLHKFPETIESFHGIEKSLDICRHLDSALEEACGKKLDVLIRVSSPGASLPVELIKDSPERDSQEETRQRGLDRAVDHLSSFLENLQAPQHLALAEKAAGKWQGAVLKSLPEITALVSVFEDHVFPLNRFNRRRAAFKGSSLDLGGLIKAVITDFNYKKYFSARCAGGRRQYSVILLIDLSASMAGQPKAAVATALVLLTTALTMIGLENFSLITFSDSVRVLKTAGQAWDSVMQATLLSQLHTDVGFRTLDADAIAAAMLHCDTEGGRGTKRIFVFTDGYSSQPREVAHVLHRADCANIQVVGISVSAEMGITRRLYQHWIQVALPAALPDAFRDLYATTEGATWTTVEEVSSLDHIGRSLRMLPTLEDVDAMKQIIEKRTSVFSGMVNKFKNERSVRLSPGAFGTFTVDIAFVLDVTGSMAPVLHAIKGEIESIAEKIPAAVAVEFKSLKLLLRTALVPYRDSKDDLIEPTEFALSPDLVSALADPNQNDIHKLRAALKELKGEGGGDLPEDTFAALERTAKLNWGKN
jgi:hypothetical protein